MLIQKMDRDKLLNNWQKNIRNQQILYSKLLMNNIMTKRELILILGILKIFKIIINLVKKNLELKKIYMIHKWQIEFLLAQNLLKWINKIMLECHLTIPKLFWLIHHQGNKLPSKLLLNNKVFLLIKTQIMIKIISLILFILSKYNLQIRMKWDHQLTSKYIKMEINSKDMTVVNNKLAIWDSQIKIHRISTLHSLVLLHLIDFK